MSQVAVTAWTTGMSLAEGRDGAVGLELEPLEERAAAPCVSAGGDDQVAAQDEAAEGDALDHERRPRG